MADHYRNGACLVRFRTTGPRSGAASCEVERTVRLGSGAPREQLSKGGREDARPSRRLTASQYRASSGFVMKAPPRRIVPHDCCCGVSLSRNNASDRTTYSVGAMAGKSQRAHGDFIRAVGRPVAGARGRRADRHRGERHPVRTIRAMCPDGGVPKNSWTPPGWPARRLANWTPRRSSAAKSHPGRATRAAGNRIRQRKARQHTGLSVFSIM
jgi:hypothetical protein